MKNLKIARIKKDITQLKLAEILHVRRETIWAWETGKINISVDMLKKVSELLEVTTDYLLGLED